jgi:hypothetical protein
MSVKEIEAAITKLPAEAVSELTAWLVDYHHQLWDHEIEEDLEAGRLDAVLSKAEKDYKAGKAKPL